MTHGFYNKRIIIIILNINIIWSSITWIDVYGQRSWMLISVNSSFKHFHISSVWRPSVHKNVHIASIRRCHNCNQSKLNPRSITCHACWQMYYWTALTFFAFVLSSLSWIYRVLWRVLSTIAQSIAYMPSQLLVVLQWCKYTTRFTRYLLQAIFFKSNSDQEHAQCIL